MKKEESDMLNVYDVCFKIGQITTSGQFAEGSSRKGGSLDAPTSLQDMNTKTRSPVSAAGGHPVTIREAVKGQVRDRKILSFLDEMEPPTLHHLSLKRPFHSCRASLNWGFSSCNQKYTN